MRAAMMAALTIVLALTAQIPLIGGLGLFLLPLPLALVGVMHGLSASALGISVTSLVLMLLMGPLGAAFYLPFAVISLVIGVGFYYGVAIKWILIGGLFLVGSSVWFNAEMVAKLQGIDLQSETEKLRESVMSHYNSQFVEPAKVDREKISADYEQLRSSLTAGVAELENKKRDLDYSIKSEATIIQTGQSLQMMLKYQQPFLLFSLFVILACEITLLRIICKRMRLVDIPPIQFSTWNCPGVLSWFLLAFLAISLWSKQSIIPISSETWIVSLSFSVQLIYFVFGLSFMTFLMLRYQVSVPVRVILYSLSLFYGPVLVFLGIFDSLFNFRKAYFSASQQTTCGQL